RSIQPCRSSIASSSDQCAGLAAGGGQEPSNNRASSACAGAFAARSPRAKTCILYCPRLRRGARRAAIGVLEQFLEPRQIAVSDRAGVEIEGQGSQARGPGPRELFRVVPDKGRLFSREAHCGEGRSIANRIGLGALQVDRGNDRRKILTDAETREARTQRLGRAFRVAQDA